MSEWLVLCTIIYAWDGMAVNYEAAFATRAQAAAKIAEILLSDEHERLNYSALCVPEPTAPWRAP